MSFPARLHVLLARDSPAAVVIRRGPSDRVATIGWDRRTDTFTDGQWLHGRIYERRSDLSPDGKHPDLLRPQRALRLRGRWFLDRGLPSAVAACAVTLLGKGDGWHGGGLFTGNRHYWLNDGSRAPRDPGVHRDPAQPRVHTGAPLRRRVPRRLLPAADPRRLDFKERREIGRMESLTVFDKTVGNGWLLRKLAHEQVNAPEGKGCYWDEHLLIHPQRAVTIVEPDWEWAEVDGDRLVFASLGCLFSVAPPGPDADARWRSRRCYAISTP